MISLPNQIHGSLLGHQARQDPNCVWVPFPVQQDLGIRHTHTLPPSLLCSTALVRMSNFQIVNFIHLYFNENLAFSTSADKSNITMNVPCPVTLQQSPGSWACREGLPLWALSPPYPFFWHVLTTMLPRVAWNSQFSCLSLFLWLPACVSKHSSCFGGETNSFYVAQDFDMLSNVFKLVTSDPLPRAGFHFYPSDNFLLEFTLHTPCHINKLSKDLISIYTLEISKVQSLS